jgi:hypothetical protein
VSRSHNRPVQVDCVGLACLRWGTWCFILSLQEALPCPSSGLQEAFPCPSLGLQEAFPWLSSGLHCLGTCILLDLLPYPVCLSILLSVSISSTSDVQCFIPSTHILLDTQPNYEGFSSPTSSVLLDAQPDYKYFFASSLGMPNLTCLGHLLMFSMLL